MIRIFVEITIHILFFISLPYVILKKRTHLFQLIGRLGFDYLKARESINNSEFSYRKTLVINACSVGENNAIFSLVEKLKKENTTLRIIHTVTTDTGYKLAKKKSKADLVTWYPLENFFSNRLFLNIFKPDLFIAVETEIWPEMFYCLNDRKIPIVIINGRISDRSFKRYKQFKIFTQNILSKITLFLMQSEIDSKRIIELGADKSKVINFGNLKYDILEEIVNKKSGKTFGFKKDDLIFTFGSIHPNEEYLVIGMINSIKTVLPNSKFIIAPRKFDKIDLLLGCLKKEKLSFERLSELNNKNKTKNDDSILILDTFGDLIDAYRISYGALIGGSFINSGGHNPLEVVAAGKMVFFGPYMNNFREIENFVLEIDGAIKFKDEEDAIKSIKDYVKNIEPLIKRGKLAQKKLMKKMGITDRMVHFLLQVLK